MKLGIFVYNKVFVLFGLGIIGDETAVPRASPLSDAHYVVYSSFSLTTISFEQSRCYQDNKTLNMKTWLDLLEQQCTRI
jgi:hypothetical protein